MTQPNRNVGDGSAAEFFIPFKKGSNLVASVEENLIIKIFPPFLNFQWESERLSLQQLWRKVETQTPEFLFQGEKDSWLYLIFSKLEGISFEQVWPIASEEEKTSILSQIGQLIGQLHQVPVGTLIQLEPKWEKFVLEQKQSCYSCHKNLNLPQHFTLEIDRYLTSVERYLPKHFNSCILTGEYTPENIILQRTDFKQTIRGLIDFGDIMLVAAEYDLLGPSIFLCEGKQNRIRSLLLGRGYKEQDFNDELKYRLMGLTLIHRYSNLKAQVIVSGWKTRARNLLELQNLIWNFE